MFSNDTSPEAEKILTELYRDMPVTKKVRLIFHAYNTARQLAMAGIKLSNPSATGKQIWHLWAKKHLGEKLYNEVYGNKNNE
jgi:hypothetical protein